MSGTGGVLSSIDRLRITMPITFDCHRCGMPLQVPDDQAGGLAQCPHCEIVCPVPDELLPVEELPPLDVEVVSEPAAEADVELVLLPILEPVAVPRNPWDRTGQDGAPANREPRRGSPGHWRSFGQGCKFVKRGVVVEMLGVGFLFALMEAGVLENTATVRFPRDVPEAEYCVLLLFVPLTVGAGLIALGRTMMLRVPLGTGGGAILVVAAGLSYLRFVLLVLATLFQIMAAVEDVNAAKVKPQEWAGRVFVLAIFAGLVAEVSVVPALAVVGGEMPSRPLRHRAAAVTFVFQLLGALLIAMIVSFTYMDAVRELPPPRAPGQPGAGRAAPAPRLGYAGTGSDRRPRRRVRAPGRIRVSALLALRGRSAGRADRWRPLPITHWRRHADHVRVPVVREAVPGARRIRRQEGEVPVLPSRGTGADGR
jgi:hypothetical protein